MTRWKDSPWKELSNEPKHDLFCFSPSRKKCIWSLYMSLWKNLKFALPTVLKKQLKILLTGLVRQGYREGMKRFWSQIIRQWIRLNYDIAFVYQNTHSLIYHSAEKKYKSWAALMHAASTQIYMSHSFMKKLHHMVEDFIQKVPWKWSQNVENRKNWLICWCDEEDVHCLSRISH